MKTNLLQMPPVLHSEHSAYEVIQESVCCLKNALSALDSLGFRTSCLNGQVEIKVKNG